MRERIRLALGVRGWLAVAALLGASGVAFGAGGAHALRPLMAPEYVPTFETGVRYHLLHAVALLALALGGAGRPIALPAALFTLGTLLFSGSLYTLALGGPRGLGIVTPFGGVALLLGWLALLRLVLPRR
jgi:uncharacterized membrane protein YgdD (TMEM256/DUF423 family)